LSNCFSKSDKPELRSDENEAEMFIELMKIVERDIAANDEMKIEMI
jgi:hypothetical protein